MSRTIRRKHMRLPRWSRLKLVRLRPYFWMYVPRTEEELKEKLKELRMDSYQLTDNPPAWFRRDLNRLRRARDKQETGRVMVNGIYYEYSYNPRRRDAAWLWT